MPAYVATILMERWQPTLMDPSSHEEISIDCNRSYRVGPNDALTAYFTYRFITKGRTWTIPVDDFSILDPSTLKVIGSPEILVRGIYATTDSPLEKAPIALRIFVRDSFFSRVAQGPLVETENALSSLMNQSAGRVIIETKTQLSNAVSNQLTQDAGESSRTRHSGEKVLAHASCAREQKTAAQKLLDTMAIARYARPLSLSRYFVNSYSTDSHSRSNSSVINFNLTTWSLSSEFTSEAPWVPCGGFVLSSLCSGRRRTMSAVIATLAESDRRSPNPSVAGCQLGSYFAFKLTIVVCNSSSIEKWETELALRKVPTLSVTTREDLFRVTYERVSAGGAILVIPEVLQYIKLDETDAIAAMRAAYHESVDVTQARRAHVGSLADRFPKAIVPLSWVFSACVIVELDLEGATTPEAADEVKKTVLDTLTSPSPLTPSENVPLLQSGWTWILTKGRSIAPSHIPPWWIDACSPLLGLKTNHVKGLPMLWSEFNDSSRFKGFVHRLVSPKTMKRIITPIAVPSSCSPFEIQFFMVAAAVQTTKPFATNANAWKNQTFPLITEFESLLLGGSLNKSHATSLVSLVRPSLVKHYSLRESGTLAQRLSTNPGSARADPDFALHALEQRAQGMICSVCTEDPVKTVTMCGHGFCLACSEKVIETAYEPAHMCSACPICRAPLTQYDWDHLEAGEIPEPTLTTKMTDLKVLCSRLMQKKTRRAETNILRVVVPGGAFTAVGNLLNTIESRSSIRPRVCTIQHLEACVADAESDFINTCSVVFASPPPRAQSASLLLKMASFAGRHTMSPIPTFIMFEDIAERVDASAAFSVLGCELS